MSEQQVSKEHYTFESYGFEGRFVSYYWQLHEVLSRKSVSLLEVGVGDRVFGSFITQNTSVQYTSIDIAEDLHPDVLGSVTKLPFPDNSFDITCAFEVLEHLPFEEFDTALSELCRVARNYVAVSLPHFGPMLAFSLKIPFIPLIRVAVKIPYARAHVFNGQHYWEIGKRGYPIAKIRSILAQHGKIESDFIPFNNSYHHAFVLVPFKKTSDS